MDGPTSPVHLSPRPINAIAIPWLFLDGRWVINIKSKFGSMIWLPIPPPSRPWLGPSRNETPRNRSMGKAGPRVMGAKAMDISSGRTCCLVSSGCPRCIEVKSLRTPNRGTCSWTSSKAILVDNTDRTVPSSPVDRTCEHGHLLFCTKW